MKKLSRKPEFSQRSKTVSVFVVAVLVTAGIVLPYHSQANAANCTSTSDCLAQINSTDNTINSSQALLSQLAGQAATYQQAISALQSQISALQSQISSTQAHEASLQKQIDDDQAKLDQQKKILGEDLKAMYVGGSMTTVEMLATSKDLSDFVDAETYDSAVQGKIQNTLNEITKLQNQLEAQQIQVKQLLTTLQAQQAQLANAQSQQQQLLSYNQSQQADYNQKLAAAKSNLGQLQANLAALNMTADSQIVMSGTCGGGYPSSAVNRSGDHWGCNYAQDGSIDNWGMLNRECVSYTAYMVAARYGKSTYGWGDAYQWIAAAEAHGYTVDQTPSAGAIAIRNRDYSEPGDVGHAMYVESVNGPDNITVNEYNENYNGTFDERTFAPSSYDSRGGMYYIHFN